MEVAKFLTRNLYTLLNLSKSSEFTEFVNPTEASNSYSVDVAISSRSVKRFVTFRTPTSFTELLINRVISNFDFPVNFSPRRDLSIKSRILFISGNLIKFGSNISRLKNRQIHVARKPDSLSK